MDSASGVVTSSGSNLGPRSATLSDEVRGRVEMIRKTGVEDPVPADLVTKSGSGLDPHISPRAAMLQGSRVAGARNLPLAEVEALVTRHTVGPTFGFIGDTRVNVLELNLALDRRTDAPAASAERCRLLADRPSDLRVELDRTSCIGARPPGGCVIVPAGSVSFYTPDGTRGPRPRAFTRVTSVT